MRIRDKKIIIQGIRGIRKNAYVNVYLNAYVNAFTYPTLTLEKQNESS
jgi:hypothetical protein